jgi:hypothetical protein
MPFMQRITWSGVAMHAGVLPGYPASHGCIRMPLAFATKLWGWTKMGARVVVTPGEITPHSFAHPLLATQKIVPQPVAADEPKVDAPLAKKADKAAESDVGGKTATSAESLELRSTVGHGDGARTQTADASSASASNAAVTMTDAGAGNGSPRRNPVSKPDDASNTDAKREAAATASAEDKAPETRPSEVAIAEVKSAEAEIAEQSEKKSDEPAAVAQASSDTAKTEAVETAKVDETKVEAKAGVTTEVTQADAPKLAEKTGEKPDESVTATTGPSVPDVKKDQARLPALDKPIAKPEPAKRTGQIAAFVSRKDGKLYVRQNFAPLFDVPVSIAPSDRPLGTHVFTAQIDKDDANVLRWSVVSLPVPARYAERRDEDERASRRRRMTGAAETRPVPVPLPNSPSEALDRLSIPADAMARMVDALSTGGSIVVSDQGIAGGETGEGTDFIVSLR